MSKAVGRRAQVLEIRKLLNQQKYDIQVESDVLVFDAARAASLEKAKQYYGSSRIQGIVRGYLARLRCKILLFEYRAGGLIVKIARGKLGRLRWMREYWKSISVVKSPEALEAIIERSIPKRDSKEASGPAWREMYDPVTGGFWYYERKSKLNTWRCPLVLQKNLICPWMGFSSFGGLPGDGPCKCVFDSVAQYHGHLQRNHKWYCVACSTRNFGANFPVCTLCRNQYSDSSEDGVDVLENAVKDVGIKVSAFLADQQELVSQKGDKFVLKDHLIKLSLEKERKRLERKEKRLAGGIASTNTSKAETEGTSKDQSSFSESGSQQGKKSAKAGHKTKGKSKLPTLINKKDVEQERAIEQWEKKDRERRVKVLKVTGCMLPLAPLWGVDGNQGPPLLYQDRDDKVNPNAYAGLFRSVTESIQSKDWIANGGFAGEKERFRDPITKGIIPPNLFEKVVKVKAPAGALGGALALRGGERDSDEESEEEGDTFDDDGSEADTLPTVEETLQEELTDFLGNEDGEAKLLVCAAYLDGHCSLSICPRAHPGKRDSAEVLNVRLPGRPRKSLYVQCCPDYDGSVITGCKAAGNCKKYHIYIRPSTKDIILRIYPREEGEKSKLLPSGAEITGNLHNNKLQGYGVMNWVNGSTYCGNWQDDLRSGFGIYRTPYGTDYTGGWKYGKREGFGCYVNSIGEEYIGEWIDGKMEGVGQLKSKSGDSYSGCFKNHKYHGVGVFTRVNGDRFMGYSQEGMACGLGIIALGTGEKYKGNFDRNFRHGKGVCSYSNGAKYAGMWYRGVPHGFGIFVAPNGERYVGHFAGGKKHGHGRYFFLDGSFYDGEFHKNLAQGQGVYFFACGDKYTGEWMKDKRNGRGTYLYANGSVYTGNWVDNNIDGKGKFDWSYGAHYRGEFSRNCKHGRGIFIWPNGNTYKGMFDREKLSGPGQMDYATGHKYVGMWANNMKHGKGTFTYVNGAVYSGDWVEDSRHGTGKLTFLPGTFIEEYYDGEWYDDEKHGKGTYAFRKDEGTVYTGDWSHGRREGVGKLSYLDGSYYRGDFVEERMQGRGVFVGKDGSQYEGEWHLNMRQGIGTLLSADGCIYHGHFHNNMKDGKGRLQYADGNIFEGVWEGNVVRGDTMSAKYTMVLGATSRGGPEEVTVKCFPY